MSAVERQGGRLSRAHSDAAAHRPEPLVGAVVGVALVGAASASMLPFHRDLSRATPALVLMVPVIVAAILGGTAAAICTAVAGDVAFSVGFVPPVGSLGVSLPEDAVALAVFLGAGAMIGTLAAREVARRRAAEARSLELSVMHARLETVTAERERLAEEHTRLVVLRQMDEQRSALLRSVSHDFRTPLAAIRAIATDLRSGVAYPEETRDELLTIVAEQAARLDRLVANLLNMSRIEAGALRLEREAIDPSGMLAETIRSLRALYSGTTLTVDVEPDLPDVWADWVQLEQVLLNLVDNAVRHSPAGGRVHLAARSATEGMVATVSDTGPGVAAAIAGRVFEPFQSGSPSRSTGLGLAICRSIVEAHGGTIDLLPVDRGAAFAFTIPWADA